MLSFHYAIFLYIYILEKNSFSGRKTKLVRNKNINDTYHIIRFSPPNRPQYIRQKEKLSWVDKMFVVYFLNDNEMW